jgi:hypothetical protein
MAAAAIVPLTSAATAHAGATTTKYTRATFLQHALGLPASVTNPAIDSVTYDRFQHLLRQEGNLALLIGDPKTDPTFAERAREVEAAARAAGVGKVYWFNPNLSGGVTLTGVTVPDLDIRDAASITTLTASSRNKYKDAWGNLIAQSLGNGIVATRTNPGAQGQAVVTAAGANVNDAEDPVYDYSAGDPAGLTDSYFFVYNTEHTSGGQPDKIVSAVNLTEETDAAAKVAAALAGRTFATVGQFEWWKEEANERARVAATNPSRGPDVPVLTDADNRAADGGWRVLQVTLPELVDLLTHATDADAAILFGGTWCPNTRAVLPFVNREAQKNDVTVFNYDTVLDGGKVAGNPTGGSNPLQTRNAHGNGAFPSFLYGQLIEQFLSNFQTQYQVNEPNAITFFPGGDTTKPERRVARLQVPYLFAYQGQGGDAPAGGVTRQWIIKLNETANREYMSNWWMTNPQPFQVGLTQLPQDAPYWTTLNQQIAAFSWKTDVASVLPDRSISSDAAQFLVDSDTATVTPTSTGASVSTGGPVVISPAALAAAKAALGAAAPATLADARAAHVAERAKPEPDATVLGHLTTIIGAYGVADQRKGSIIQTWGSATAPDSIAGGAAAKRALEVFFGGLPNGVMTSTRTVSAPAAVTGKAPTVKVAVANPAGRVPTGAVALEVTAGDASVFTGNAPAPGGTATFTLPALPAGTYALKFSYPGDDGLQGWTESGTLTVSQAPVVPPPPGPGTTPDPDPVVVPISTPVPDTTTPAAVTTKAKARKLAAKVTKAATSRKTGKLKVTVTTAPRAAKATGKVTVTFKKGKTTRKVTGRLKNGTVTVAIPKLARGTWTVRIAWAGDAQYEAATASAKSIKVKR